MPQSAPFILQPEGGARIAYLGGEATFKITTDETGAGWGFSIETFPGGFASALHMHPTEDSGFYILSGRMRVRAGDLEGLADPGGFIWLPRGVPHAFKVEGDQPCTWINVQGPTGDFRRLIEETGVLVQPGDPLPPLTRPDPQQQAEAAARNNLVRLGPSPFAGKE